MPNDHFETETVRAAVVDASDFVGQYSARHFGEFAHGMGPTRRFESPIEAVFWVWFQAFLSLDVRIAQEIYSFNLLPQHEVVASDGSLFRLDFAIPDFKIAVELDGHDFHERTKEQVAHRNMRDRKLQADGWTVLHISGSELWKAPLDRVEEVYGLCVRHAQAELEAKWDTAAAQRAISKSQSVAEVK